MAHAPEMADLEVIELGQGLDNSAFVVGELVLRVAHGPSVAREGRLLEYMATPIDPDPKTPVR